MDCPECGAPNTRVLDTFKGQVTRRRRQCPCGVTFSSTEVVDKGSVRSLPVPISRNQSPPVAVIPDQPQPSAVNYGGGVGGALPSGSDLSGFLDPHPVAADPPDRAIPVVHAQEPGLWNSDRWLKKFGAAWVKAYRNGMGTYGGGAPDAKAGAILDDQIRALPLSEAMAAQERAPAMFAEFLADRGKALVDARHSFAFFVGRWGGLRIPAMKVAPSNGRSPEPNYHPIARLADGVPRPRP